MYRVFLGAPSLSALTSTDDEGQSSLGYHWQTVSSTDTPAAQHQQVPSATSSLGANDSSLFATPWLQRSASYGRIGRSQAEAGGRRPEESMVAFVYPPATLEAASRRISLVYRNAIFDRSEGEEDDEGGGADADGTAITWPPTNPEEADDSGAGRTGVGPLGDLTSFLLGDASVEGAKSGLVVQDVEPAGDTTNAPNESHISDSGILETQETQSFNYSDASSSAIGHFPTFHFNIHTLTPLALVSRPGEAARMRGRKMCFLLAVLEVEGPDVITIRKGREAGKQVGILKGILGDEEGRVCKFTGWREVAEEWGGVGEGEGWKRGDVVYLENLTAECEPSMSPTLTASPNLKSKMTVCYRTMPHAHEDGAFRPDLRLGESDPCVRKVASVVRWFERMAGLPGEGR
ncbi:hypothetical protein DFP72DRAFT_1069694 [Ephemerocybe angulata]|uniref:Uncharacterized protein n=1 Tax=Ephemerocybe angulata TaxID=980116 RepID=A0A8H6M5W5_9AGAR|nr:hypothetical protein DFP72DRAFT_1069694 [Tulosesus angulatus]